MQLQIVLADDHKLFREGLRTLIAEQQDMCVAAEAEDGAAAVRIASEISPDIIIMDISMPRMNGIEAARRLSAQNSRARIIALSMHLEQRMISEMLLAGASGYLLKDCAFDELIIAIRAVADNRVYLSSKIAEIMCRDGSGRMLPVQTPAPRDSDSRECNGMPSEEAERAADVRSTERELSPGEIEDLCRQIMHNPAPYLDLGFCGDASVHQKNIQTLPLTGREKEILWWVREGKSASEISSILFVSRNTVKFHMKNIYVKLCANSKHQALAVAEQKKLLDE